MHELALADSVVKAALQAADEAGIDRIARIVVKVGELQQIEKDLFEFSLTSVIPSQDKRLTDVDIDAAGDEGEAVHFIPELSHAFARCPSCGSPDFDITHGRGITLEQIEGIVDGGD